MMYVGSTQLQQLVGRVYMPDRQPSTSQCSAANSSQFTFFLSTTTPVVCAYSIYQLHSFIHPFEQPSVSIATPCIQLHSSFYALSILTTALLALATVRSTTTPPPVSSLCSRHWLSSSDSVQHFHSSRIMALLYLEWNRSRPQVWEWGAVMKDIEVFIRIDVHSNALITHEAQACQRHAPMRVTDRFFHGDIRIGMITKH